MSRVNQRIFVGMVGCEVETEIPNECHSIPSGVSPHVKIRSIMSKGHKQSLCDFKCDQQAGSRPRLVALCQPWLPVVLFLSDDCLSDFLWLVVTSLSCREDIFSDDFKLQTLLASLSVSLSQVSLSPFLRSQNRCLLLILSMTFSWFLRHPSHQEWIIEHRLDIPWLTSDLAVKTIDWGVTAFTSPQSNHDEDCFLFDRPYLSDCMQRCLPSHSPCQATDQGFQVGHILGDDGSQLQRKEEGFQSRKLFEVGLLGSWSQAQVFLHKVSSSTICWEICGTSSYMFLTILFSGVTVVPALCRLAASASDPASERSPQSQNWKVWLRRGLRSNKADRFVREAGSSRDISWKANLNIFGQALDVMISSEFWLMVHVSCIIYFSTGLLRIFLWWKHYMIYEWIWSSARTQRLE